MKENLLTSICSICAEHDHIVNESESNMQKDHDIDTKNINYEVYEGKTS